MRGTKIILLFLLLLSPRVLYAQDLVALATAHNACMRSRPGVQCPLFPGVKPRVARQKCLEMVESGRLRLPKPTLPNCDKIEEMYSAAFPRPVELDDDVKAACDKKSVANVMNDASAAAEASKKCPW